MDRREPLPVAAAGNPVVATTARLQLGWLDLADAPAMLRLLNEAGFLRYIGDKGVRDLAQAEAYLRDGPLASYAEHGFGLWRVSRRDNGETIGMVGMLKRDWLDAPDIGYALFDDCAGQGYASEAAAAVCELADTRFGLDSLLAIVDPENGASIRLLEKLGFVADGEFTVPGANKPIRLFQRCRPAAHDHVPTGA